MRNPRRLAAAVVILFVAVLALYTAYWLFMRITALRLMENPEPLPTYISAIAPFPGTEYPTDLYSHPYWGEVYSQHGICVRVDARIILRGLADVVAPTSIETELAFEDVPRNSVNLYLDGKLFDKENWIDKRGSLQPAQVRLSAIPMTLPNPTVPTDHYLAHVPINFCWRTDLSAGLHSAEITVRSYKGILRYRWAFRMIEH